MKRAILKKDIRLVELDFVEESVEIDSDCIELFPAGEVYDVKYLGSKDNNIGDSVNLYLIIDRNTLYATTVHDGLLEFIDGSRGFERLIDSPFVQIPQRGTNKSAGYDIRASEEYTLDPGEMKAIGTGLTAYMEQDEYLDLRIRSGLAYKHNLTFQNDAGVIDADYFGKEIKVMMRNEGDHPFTVNVGDRIAQGIFTKYLLTENDTPIKDERNGGFGSTGMQ